MFEKRLKILLTILAIVCGVLILRSFQVQILQNSYWTEESAKALKDDITIATTRGRILDRKGRELAVDRPCIDAAVDYRAINTEPDIKWLRDIARKRLKAKSISYETSNLIERRRLLAEEVEVVKVDIAHMWQTLAQLSHRTDEQMNEVRQDIVRRVETRRRLVWYNKYQKAVNEQTARHQDSPWYAWLLGGNSRELQIDQFDIQVGEQIQPHVIIPNIDHDLYNKLAKEIEQYPGLELESSVVRTYPYGATACHVIGLMGKVSPKDIVEDSSSEEHLKKYYATDLIGRSGLERMMEQALRGSRGLSVIDATKKELNHIAPVGGKDIQTTIDIDLQAEIEKSFDVVAFRPHKDLEIEQLSMPGAAVVVDLQSGEVLAMASHPGFDLNTFDDDYPRLSTDVINRPLLNRATQMALEPGSTMKPIIGIGSITQGLITPDSTIECTGYLVINGKKQQFGRCWTMSLFHIGHHQVPSTAPHPNGFLSFPDALERSCNVFFETLGDKLGLEGVSYWQSQFGLGTPTDVGLDEVSGRLPNSFKGPAWRKKALSWFGAIGQGQIAATPIQMVNVAATIARRGIWMRPTLVPRDLRPPTTNPSRRPDIYDLNVSQAAISLAQQGMINVVNGPAGTGTDAAMADYLVAGKTGSAQSAPLRLPVRDELGRFVKDAKGRVMYDPLALGKIGAPNPQAPWYRAIGDNEEKVASHAWMIGFAPANNPKIAFAVLVEYGGGGGLAAGSVVKKVLEACSHCGYLPKINEPR